MVLSKRERIILIVTLACVGLLLGSKFAYDPMKAKLDDLGMQRTSLEGELTEANLLLENLPRWQRTWKDLKANGLQNATETESRVFSALREWSRTAGMSVSSIKPDRISSDKGMHEMIFTVAGKGSLESVARLLWEIETAPLPVKIKDMTLGSSSDAGESMSLQLHLSALYLGPENSQTKKNASEVSDEQDI
jgi:hypothetical protein